uniref:Torso-like protein n=2 Tax=Lygus hesperus TaxID=30085 RepID=A0A0A9XRS6_LYGHE
MPGSSWMTICFIIVCCLRLATSQAPELDRVGAAVNILRNFGDLDLEFRITPRNDTERWVFNSDPVYVLKDINVRRKSFNGSIGQFRLEMCRGKDELLDSFFRHVTIEGVEQPWRAFSRGWSVSKEPRTLGVASALSYELGYLLLKLDMKRDEVLMTNQEIELSTPAKELFEKIVVNDTKSVTEFQKKFGTHYIHSYSTGNSLFQVLTYRMKDFEYLERKLSSEGASNMTFAYLSKFFSPLYTKEIGQVMVTSGNFNSTVWANGLMSRKYGKNESKFPSLFSLMWRPWLLDQFETLDSGAITSLELKFIDRAFSEPSDRKEWFKEVTQYLVRLNEEQV